MHHQLSMNLRLSPWRLRRFIESWWCIWILRLASSEQQTKNPNAPPAFNESAQPPGAQARDGSPGKKPLASPSVAVSRKEEAWHTLETACTGDKATDRANATRVLGLIRNDVKATKLAEKG